MPQNRVSRLARLGLLAVFVSVPAILWGQSTSSAPQASTSQPEPPPEAVAAFRRVLATRYVTQVSAESLARARTMDDLLALVRTDPFTDVYSPTEWQHLTVSLGEAFGGIGAILGSIRDTVVLGDLLPDGPAAASGLHSRDRLLAIDDSMVLGWTVEHVVSRIRGRPGTPVTLRVLRGSDTVPPIHLVRASVQAPSVPAASLNTQGVGVVTISQFGPGLTADLASTIDGMLAHGLKRLVLDLRGNPGGLLDEAIGVANLFLPQGSLLVETRYRGEAPDRHLAEEAPRYPTLPLAVLVGPESASASEILAGALQDARRAVIVGRQTYGKGLVQTTAPLGGGWMAKFTVGRWYTPAGRLIDRGVHASADSTKPFDPEAPHSGGIEPEVVLPDSVQDAARQALKLLDTFGSSVYLALDDEVGHFLATHPNLTASSDPFHGSGDRILVASGIDSLDANSRAIIVPWLDAEVTRRAIEARFGYGAALIWQDGRDPQVAAAVALLTDRGQGSYTTSQR
ncbi:MAG TPA: S41 family peptidase [Gemmatimonadales bacterium]|nr:S41 family peptidase [Gemmatimonadales bacterium]